MARLLCLPSPVVWSNRILTVLLNHVERSVSPSLPGVSRVPSDHLAGSTRHPSGHHTGSAKAPASVMGQSVNSNAGKHCCISFSDVMVYTEMMHISSVGIYTGCSSESEEACFLLEQYYLTDLLGGLENN